VEVVIPRANRMLGVLEPLLERVVFEDLPANLAGVKRRVEALRLERAAEALDARGQGGRAESLRRKSARPRLAGETSRCRRRGRAPAVGPPPHMPPPFCLLPPPADMSEDWSILEAELVRCFGAEGALPTRSDLREMNRWGRARGIAMRAA
jgi:hypothetical protein